MEIATTSTGALKILWKNKFFLKEKRVKDIEEKLTKMGYNFADSALAMALKRAKYLTRRGTYGKYSYKQKYPYFEEQKKK